MTIDEVIQEIFSVSGWTPYEYEGPPTSEMLMLMILDSSSHDDEWWAGSTGGEPPFPPILEINWGKS